MQRNAKCTNSFFFLILLSFYLSSSSSVSANSWIQSFHCNSPVKTVKESYLICKASELRFSEDLAAISSSSSSSRQAKAGYLRALWLMLFFFFSPLSSLPLKLSCEGSKELCDSQSERITLILSQFLFSFFVPHSPSSSSVHENLCWP